MSKWMDCEDMYDIDGLYHICGNIWAERRAWQSCIDGINMNHLFNITQISRNTDDCLWRVISSIRSLNFEDLVWPFVEILEADIAAFDIELQIP